MVGSCDLLNSIKINIMQLYLMGDRIAYMPKWCWTAPITINHAKPTLGSRPASMHPHLPRLMLNQCCHLVSCQRGYIGPWVEINQKDPVYFAVWCVVLNGYWYSLKTIQHDIWVAGECLKETELNHLKSTFALYTHTCTSYHVSCC